MCRSQRTKQFIEKIKLDTSYEMLKNEIEIGKKNGEIYNLYFWDEIIYHDFFRIEWLKECNKSNDNPFYYSCFWDFEYISDHPNFDINWVNEYPNEDWDWENIGNAKKFDISWVTQFPNKSWNWELISINTNFSMDWVYQYPNKAWDWDYINENDYYKIVFIRKTFNIQDTDIFQKKIREYMATYKIQQWWKEITISPNYQIGRKFINKKYDELFN